MVKQAVGPPRGGRRLLVFWRHHTRPADTY